MDPRIIISLLPSGLSCLRASSFRLCRPQGFWAAITGLLQNTCTWGISLVDPMKPIKMRFKGDGIRRCFYVFYQSQRVNLKSCYLILPKASSFTLWQCCCSWTPLCDSIIFISQVESCTMRSARYTVKRAFSMPCGTIPTLSTAWRPANPWFSS